MQLRRLLLATLLLAIMVVSLAFAANGKKLTVHIYHARLGPVYQKLPDGRVIMLYADIYYPDTLYLQPPNVLGTINVTVHTNWTGPWDGIITVMVVDPGYRIDPTTFKPTNSMYAWAAGGATIGAGDILAPEGAIYNKTVTRTVNLTAHLRFFRAKPGTYRVQYFFRVRAAFFDPKTLEKVPGGDINIYTVSEGAPYATLIIREESSKQKHAIPMNLVIDVTAAATAAAVAYIVLDRFWLQKRK